MTNATCTSGPKNALRLGRLVCIGLAAMFCHAGLAPVEAANSAAIIRLYVVQQPVATVFETVGNLAGMAFQVDPGIDAIARQANLQGTTAQVVAQLSRIYNLHYWFDGARYTISTPASLMRKTISTDKVSNEFVKATILNAAPFVSDNAIDFNQNAQLLSLYGPRELVDSIEKLLANYTRDVPDSVAIIRYGMTNR